MLIKPVTVSYGDEEKVCCMAYTVEAMLDIEDLTEEETVFDILEGRGSHSLQKKMAAFRILNREGMRISRELGYPEGDRIPESTDEIRPIDFIRLKSAAWAAVSAGMTRQILQDEVDMTLSEMDKKKE